MPLNNLGLVHRHASGAVLLRSAQPGRDGLAMLKALFSPLTIIKLNSSHEFPEETEREYARVLAVPMSIFSPTAQSVTDTCAAIEHELGAGQNVLVHCMEGKDRTGVVCGAYRLLHCGWTYEQMQTERESYGCNFVRDIPDHRIVEVLRSLARKPLTPRVNTTRPLSRRRRVT